jgi:hypothetical protein
VFEKNPFQRLFAFEHAMRLVWEVEHLPLTALEGFHLVSVLMLLLLRLS